MRLVPAGWQSGYAAACKAVNAGSIPTPAFILSTSCPGGGIGRHKGLKIPRGQLRAGSSPAPGTMLKFEGRSGKGEVRQFPLTVGLGAVFPFHGLSLARPALIPGVSHSKIVPKLTSDKQRELMGEGGSRGGDIFSGWERGSTGRAPGSAGLRATRGFASIRRRRLRTGR